MLQMVSIIDALGVARVLDTHFYLAAAERIRQDANAYTVCVCACVCAHVVSQPTIAHTCVLSAVRVKSTLSVVCAYVRVG